MHAMVRLMLRGSLAAAVAIAAVTGCGGDDDDATDNTGDGGDGSGGDATAGSTSTSGNAGEPQTGAGAPTTGGTTTTEAGAGPGGAPSTGGAGPADGGAAQGGDGSIFGGAPNAGGAGGVAPAVAKFCNTSSDDMTLRLEIGQGAAKVTFTAAPGECAPADGEACSEVATGQAVIVSLYDDANDQLPLYVNPHKIADGEAWIFSVEQKGVNTTWTGRTLKAGVACEDVTFADL